jgi:hypothetical protein
MRPRKQGPVGATRRNARAASANQKNQRAIALREPLGDDRPNSARPARAELEVQVRSNLDRRLARRFHAGTNVIWQTQK